MGRLASVPSFINQICINNRFHVAVVRQISAEKRNFAACFDTAGPLHLHQGIHLWVAYRAFDLVADLRDVEPGGEQPYGVTVQNTLDGLHPPIQITGSTLPSNVVRPVDDGPIPSEIPVVLPAPSFGFRYPRALEAPPTFQDTYTLPYEYHRALFFPKPILDSESNQHLNTLSGPTLANQFYPHTVFPYYDPTYFNPPGVAFHRRSCPHAIITGSRSLITTTYIQDGAPVSVNAVDPGLRFTPHVFYPRVPAYPYGLFVYAVHPRSETELDMFKSPRYLCATREFIEPTSLYENADRTIELRMLRSAWRRMSEGYETLELDDSSRAFGYATVQATAAL
ncbi:hypothetical protein BDZ89DRAFT_1036742 [Hymenopellis radicata]|nr:hypothetical protein BDZ89DRAFT_1036742 [Hymenopellis radicata]